MIEAQIAGPLRSALVLKKALNTQLSFSVGSPGQLSSTSSMNSSTNGRAQVLRWRRISLELRSRESGCDQSSELQNPPADSCRDDAVRYGS